MCHKFEKSAFSKNYTDIHINYLLINYLYHCIMYTECQGNRWSNLPYFTVSKEKRNMQIYSMSVLTVYM